MTLPNCYFFAWYSCPSCNCPWYAAKQIMSGAGSAARTSKQVWISSTQVQAELENRTGSLLLVSPSFPHNSHCFPSVTFTENSYGHSDHLWSTVTQISGKLLIWGWSHWMDWRKVWGWTDPVNLSEEQEYCYTGSNSIPIRKGMTQSCDLK